MRINDYSGTPPLFQGTKCVEVDFTDVGEYSESASGTTGYFDVYEELNKDFAYIHLENAGKLDVVFAEDDTEVLFPFQAGTTEHKIKRIYYHVDNTVDKFYVVYW